MEYDDVLVPSDFTNWYSIKVSLIRYFHRKRYTTRSEFDAFLLARSDAKVLERVAITNAFLTRFGYQTPNSFGGMAGMR